MATRVILAPGLTRRDLVVGILMGAAGMKFTGAGTAAVLNQTSIVFIILLARIVLKEPFTRRRMMACALAVLGVAAVILG